MNSIQQTPNFVAVLAAVVALFIATTSVHSEETRLTAAEIKAAISGNSISGTWRGAYYTQYFTASGQVIHQQFGSTRRYRGEWRVDEAENQYCSNFPDWGSACYEVFRDGDTIFWVNSSTGERKTVKLLSGERLN